MPLTIGDDSTAFPTAHPATVSTANSTADHSADPAHLRRMLVHLEGIAGVGVDVEAVARFERVDARIFTAVEVAYCMTHAHPAESFAGHWCAKEAVVKALGNRVRLSPRDVEVRHSAAGAPLIFLRNKGGEWAPDQGIHVSISHTEALAVAVAVVVEAGSDA